jgi:hypothetical protein
VVGTRGRTGVVRFLLGSVAERIFGMLKMLRALEAAKAEELIAYLVYAERSTAARE